MPEEQGENVALADKDEEDVDALAHVGDVGQVPLRIKLFFPAAKPSGIRKVRVVVVWGGRLDQNFLLGGISHFKIVRMS